MPARLLLSVSVTAELWVIMGPSDHFTVGKLTHCSCPHQRFCFVGMQDTVATKSAVRLPLPLVLVNLEVLVKINIISLLKPWRICSIYSLQSRLWLSPGRHPPGRDWSELGQCGDIWPSSGQHHAIIVTRATATIIIPSAAYLHIIIPTLPLSRTMTTRAGNEPSRRLKFHNHREC